MKKINLKSSELSVNRSKRKSGNMSLSISVVLLLIVLGSYGVLMLMNKKTNDEIASVKSEIIKIKKEMDSKDFLELYDFQSRLYEIEELISGKTSQDASLEKIAAFTLPDTSFISVEQKSVGQRTEVTAVIVVPDLYVLSQQLEAFSMIDGSKEVSLTSREQGYEGVEAELEFIINKS